MLNSNGKDILWTQKKSISFVDPDEEQLNEFLDLLEENGYPDKEKTGTAADATNVQFAGRSDRLDAYRAWLQSHTGEQDRQLRGFVQEAHERRKGSLSSGGQAAVEDTKTSSGAFFARFRTEPFIVNEAANALLDSIDCSTCLRLQGEMEDAHDAKLNP